MTKSTSTNARISEFDAYVALAWMIIDYRHVKAIPDEAISDDTSTSPSEMASGDTEVCMCERLRGERGVVKDSL